MELVSFETFVPSLEIESNAIRFNTDLKVQQRALKGGEEGTVTSTLAIRHLLREYWHLNNAFKIRAGMLWVPTKS